MDLTKLELQFTHSVQEMEIILAGLRKLPMEAVLDLYNKLHISAKAQVDQHIAEQQPAAEVPAEATIEKPAE